MTQQMTDVFLKQEPWEVPRDEVCADTGSPGMAGDDYSDLIRHSITARVMTVLSDNGCYPWEATALSATNHTLLGEETPTTPPELLATEWVKWNVLTEPDRRALLDVLFRYIGLRTDTGPKLLGAEGWEKVMNARNEIVSGSGAESKIAATMPPAAPALAPIGKVLLVMGAISILAIAGFYGFNRHRASETVRAFSDLDSKPPYLNSESTESGVLRNFGKAMGPVATLGPLESACSGDEIVCSSIRTAKPIEALRALLATIPKDAAKTYRVNVSVRSIDAE